MSIQEHLNKIRNAVYGHEVRESIAKGIETAYDDASENGNANMEVKIARGTHPNLRSRLEEVDNKQQQVTAQLQQTEQELSSQLADKRDKTVKITGADLDTATNANKIQLLNLSSEVQAVMAGTAPVISTVADGSITSEKYATNSVLKTKLSDEIIKPVNYASEKYVAEKNGYTTIVDSSTFIVAGSWTGEGVVEIGYDATRFKSSDFLPNEIEVIACSNGFQFNVFQFTSAGVYEHYHTWSTANFVLDQDKKYKIVGRKVGEPVLNNYDYRGLVFLKNHITEKNASFLNTDVLFERGALSSVGLELEDATGQALYPIRLRSKDYISGLEAVYTDDGFTCSVYEFTSADVFVKSYLNIKYFDSFVVGNKYKIAIRKSDDTAIEFTDLKSIALQTGHSKVKKQESPTFTSVQNVVGLFERGTINSLGINLDGYWDTRVRSIDYIDPLVKKIHTKTGYALIVYKYNSDGSFDFMFEPLSYFDGFITGFKYRVVLKRTDEQTITNEETSNIIFEKEATQTVQSAIDSITLKDKNGFDFKFGVNTRGKISGIDAGGNLMNDDLLVWSDEFTNPTLDLSKWRYVYGKRDIGQDGVGSPRQYYPLDQSQNVVIQDGILHLKALRNNPIDGYEWSAAFIETNNKFEFNSGRLEARIKYDEKPGSYATLWTLGAGYDRNPELQDGYSDESVGVNWPRVGEIDIAEFNSTGPASATLHYGDTRETHKSKHIGSYHAEGSNWHVYAMEWTKDRIDFFVDGVYFGGTTIDNLKNESGYNPFHHPHFFMFNSGVAWGDNAPPTDVMEYEMLVDWVRVYAPENDKEIINIESISMDTVNITLQVGETHEFITEFIPSDAQDKTLNWASSNETVAMVYGGKVTALSIGTATVTANTNNGISTTCNITVE